MKNPALLVLVSFPFALSAAPPPDVRQSLLDAMTAELQRNQTELKLRGHEPPYFISYQMKDYQQHDIAARYGALFQDEFPHDRKIYVDVRVGSYEFDNSIGEDMDFNFSMKGNSYVTRKAAPTDNDAVALRTALWLVTDEKYKGALFNYLKKKGESVYTVDNPKKPPSFSREKPNAHVQAPVPFPFDHARWTKAARDLSAMFNAAPRLFDSEVRVSADKMVRYFVSTEGARIVTEETLYGVHISAVTRAEDGQLLDNSRDFYASAEEKLPADRQLVDATHKLIDELMALRAAPAIDPYTGPAILEPAAAGVLFHEAVGHRLEGERQDDDAEGKTFRGQIGHQVLPPFISIFDDPTLRQRAGQELNGFYTFDEEGVSAQRTLLVENGVLRNYILSRHPVEGFLHSNGHGRSQGNRKPTARMANLLVESKRQVSDAELKRMLIAEAKRQGKPYGLIIRDITGGNTNTSTFGYQAFKGVLAPSTLLQEIELQRAMEGKDRPPILESPAAAMRKAER
jgi:predicted Zn-dependent protease